MWSTEAIFWWRIRCQNISVESNVIVATIETSCPVNFKKWKEMCTMDWQQLFQQWIFPLQSNIHPKSPVPTLLYNEGENEFFISGLRPPLRPPLWLLQLTSQNIVHFRLQIISPVHYIWWVLIDEHGQEGNIVAERHVFLSDTVTFNIWTSNRYILSSCPTAQKSFSWLIVCFTSLDSSNYKRELCCSVPKSYKYPVVINIFVLLRFEKLKSHHCQRLFMYMSTLII